VGIFWVTGELKAVYSLVEGALQGESLQDEPSPLTIGVARLVEDPAKGGGSA
jgi:hypothetical protein